MKTYHDIEGDGGSDVLGQVLEVRAAIKERLSTVDQIIAVGSGKGGVGKSTLTMQLAQTFVAAGKTVSILDADINGPCQARMAGLQNAPLVPSDQGIQVPTNSKGIGVLSFGTWVPEGASIEFESVAPTDSHTWRATREFSALSELLASVSWGKRDLLLVDLPPGAERMVQYAEFFGKEVPFVFVTIPSDVSKGVVARSIHALQALGNPLLGYIENMAGYACEGCDSIQPLFPETSSESEPKLSIPCLGKIPFDPRLASASDQGNAVPKEATVVVDALNEAAQECLARTRTLKVHVD